MKFVPKRHEPEDLNISPLIDMVFILLIFFAVSTTFVQDMNLELERPNAQSAVQADSEAIRIYIGADGATFMNDQPVKPWMIQGLVRDELAASAADTVLVIADRSTSTERLVEVVDQAKLGGAAEVGVATEQ
jgi:biopolymer transport protein ExbD